MRVRTLVPDSAAGKAVVATLCAATALLCLAAAVPASAQDAQAQQPAPQQQQSARFNMIQNGKHMSADDFDKWLESQGYHSSGQPTAAPAPEKAVAKTDTKKTAKKKAVAAKKPAVSFADVSANVRSGAFADVSAKVGSGMFADVTAKVSFQPRAK